MPDFCPKCRLSLAKPEFEDREVSRGNSPATAAEKERIYRDWVRFISGGFQRSQFHKDLYLFLINHHGDIAHYSIEGYYSDYFSSPERVMEFIQWFSQQTQQYSRWGSSSINTYAWGDLRDAMQEALNQCASQVGPSLIDARRNRQLPGHGPCSPKRG